MRVAHCLPVGSCYAQCVTTFQAANREVKSGYVSSTPYSDATQPTAGLPKLNVLATGQFT